MSSATYRYLHDQTMRLANHGHTSTEIAEQLELPPSLASVPHVRGYYGTANHNAKAVYQRYLGWFDAHPAHLHPLPPAEAGRRYVDFMGGADALLERARASFGAGDYRWVAEVLTHLVFSDPSNTDARLLQAGALEQLGYQSESGPWRDFYLTGAQELRHGPAPLGAGPFTRPEMLGAATDEMLLDLLGVRLDGPAADGRRIELTVVVTPTPDRPGDPSGAAHPIGIEHGALHRGAVRPDPGPAGDETVLRITHPALAELAGARPPWPISWPAATPRSRAPADRSRSSSGSSTRSRWASRSSPRDARGLRLGDGPAVPTAAFPRRFRCRW